MITNDKIDEAVLDLLTKLSRTFNKLATGSIRSFIQHDEANWRRNDLGKLTTAKTLASLKRLEKTGKVECMGAFRTPNWRDASASASAELAWRAVT